MMFDSSVLFIQSQTKGLPNKISKCLLAQIFREDVRNVFRSVNPKHRDAELLEVFEIDLTAFLNVCQLVAVAGGAKRCAAGGSSFRKVAEGNKHGTIVGRKQWYTDMTFSKRNRHRLRIRFAIDADVTPACCCIPAATRADQFMAYRTFDTPTRTAFARATTFTFLPRWPALRHGEILFLLGIVGDAKKTNH